MKKFLTLLLLFPLLASCSSDDDDDTVYLDNKLIEGSWYWIQASDSTVYTFKDDNATLRVIDKYTLDVRQSFNLGAYKLTQDRIIYTTKGKEGKSPYQFINGILLIMESSDGSYTKYVKAK